MSFSKDFEMNDNADLGIRSDIERRNDDEKKTMPSSPDYEMEELDLEMAHKKDCPPRFSTIFGPPMTAPAPTQTQPRQFESYPAATRKSGVRVPTAVIVVVGIIMLLETAALFTYTLIGLYNNLPTRLVSTNYHYDTQQPGKSFVKQANL